MPVPRTEDNPHGWGHIEKRIVKSHYQLSPRIAIVVGDEIKINKGPYWVNKDGVKVSVDKMKGKWKVKGIFENLSGEIELDVIQIWPGGLFGSSTSIRVTGNEYPSPSVPSVIRRAYGVKLATPRTRRKKRKDKKIGSTYVNKEVVEVEEDTDWEMLANIVKENEDA